MTRMMIALAGAAVVLLVAEHAEGFVVPQNQKMPFSTTTRCMALPTPEESAQALSNYMAKSHEEKLRAVKEVEAKTGAEIKALKEEMEVLKAATTSEMVVSGATAPALGSAEEMAAKLAAYQKFMAEYVVKAQESKVIAVQEAEKNAELKFMEKYQLMLGPASTPASTTATPVVIGSTVYQVRNAHIQKAAAAGKSRWGDLENQKAAGQVPSRPHVDGVAGPAVPALAKSPSQTIPPQVQEADHGLRADGGVGGLTLAERVTQGASSASAAAPVVVLNMASPNVAYYAKRTASVAAAGMAGKSRWGGMEIAKASSWEAPAMSAASVSVDVEEADHGLRADGGVGGPSLSERVNLGAQLLQSA
mmetsp:Transcript_23101/g.41706  ORF Transcript_23101/g.41706 Transcript_23101/m.41706 type:complete len:362 (-) Transcript_23101:383-1468(-)